MSNPFKSFKKKEWVLASIKTPNIFPLLQILQFSFSTICTASSVGRKEKKLVDVSFLMF